MDAATLAADLHALLVERGETVASAESLTGGGLADLLSSTPGASSSYVGGVVGYATSVKVKVLSVPADLVERYGAVSEECAAAMATGARDVLGATWAVSTTGVAGPTEQEGQPVGTVFVGIAGPGGVTVAELALDGDRDAIRAQTCLLALDQVLSVVGTSYSALILRRVVRCSPMGADERLLSLARPAVRRAAGRFHPGAHRGGEGGQGRR